MVTAGSITPYLNVYVKFATLDAVNTVILSQQIKLPPIMRTLATFGIQSEKIREVINFVRKTDVPGPAKALAAGMATVGVTLQMIQLLPELMDPRSFFGP